MPPINSDGDWRIRRKSRLFQPVTHQVQAGQTGKTVRESARRFIRMH
ncbi:hypothetical protein LVQ78_23770 [Buttiauxella sp. A2-C2_NF]|nr:hypothetical protein [Buttiauxella ferragutiae]MCE0829009.1 hypothetical protein [Buttiauxella ferragutiae]UNK63225.1 hypothetical protein MNO13_10140 [Buttiauxella ferragutiae]